MGNRAVIAFKDQDCGIYLHWNGGRASVEAFLRSGSELVRHDDDCYMPARLAQIIGNWLGGNLSLGVGPLKGLDCDNGDNGVYYVDSAFKITGRKFAPHIEEANAEKTEKIYRECMAVNRPIFEKTK